ncbi:DUF262 domain-containing protein [Herbidospora cretacea]|uniref:DUF262 domain-containing protein n=1 Tax=Herbidospora cretacea TaxID=28444 RepID=UPI0018CC6CD7|nr:DUF262 domain-containing protein [Herbidospora cretacea]
MTIAEALKRIHRGDWVLPAIQREFVWNTNQIRSLFDSLMRGYPVGSFLLWGLEKEQVDKFTFYDFLTDYHEKNQPYAPTATVAHGQPVVAVLDGQQRLTAINIGLYGSYAERLKYKQANNPDNYPKKWLYLNLLSPHGDDELGLKYDLRFLTSAKAAEPTTDEKRPWVKVADVLKFPDGGPAIMDAVNARGLSEPEFNHAYKLLYDLYQAIHTQQVINAFQEDSQDPDRVLDIFVRVNSGGTKLSNSDLLLSMATNQWKDLDAREEVRSLEIEFTTGPGQFRFSKDLILKAGLMLTEAPDFQFKISNFTRTNMSRLEHSWAEIRSSLLRSANLLASFGLSANNLTADSVVIPIAYYLHRHGLCDKYLTAPAHAADRALIRRWVFKSLIKRGVWGSGLDTLLRAIQAVIRNSATPEFPVDALESAMASRGKGLSFADEEIDGVLELQYGKPQTFPVLAILYPGLDLTQQFHEDHIFARSRLTPQALRKSGISSEKYEAYTSRVNGLPNLQLLGGLLNIAKSDAWPWEWLNGPHFTSDAARENYLIQNDLDLLPNELAGFVDFYEARKRRMAERLSKLLGLRTEVPEADFRAVDASAEESLTAGG